MDGAKLMYSPLSKDSFYAQMEAAEKQEGSSTKAIKKFWDWMYSDLEGTVQACAFANPVQREDETITPNGRWEHVTSYDEFEDFCTLNSGLWTYQVYSGVNTLDSTPTGGRGDIKHIDSVNHVTFDIETEKEAYAGAPIEHVWWAYKYAMAEAKYLYEEYDVLPMVVMSENGIHLHYKADFPVTGEHLHNKQHSLVKYLTHKAINSEYAKLVKEKSPNGITIEQDDVSDPARVMKVPGTMGQKSDSGRMCGIIHMPCVGDSGQFTTSNIDIPKAASMDYGKKNKEPKPLDKQTVELSADVDDDIERRIENIKNSDGKFRALFDGDTLDYNSRSEAEYAFILKLLSYGFDISNVPAIMTMSSQNKWDEEDDHYRERTLESAYNRFDGTAWNDSTSGSLSFETHSL